MGKNEEFLKYYYKFGKWIHAESIRYIGKSLDADDIEQNTWVMVLNKLDTVKDKGAFPGWLKKVFYSTAGDFVRKNKKAKAMLPIQYIEKDLKDNVKLDFDIKDEVDCLLHRLPKKDAQLLSDYYLGNLTNREMMEKNNKSLSATKSELHRAKENAKLLIWSE